MFVILLELIHLKKYIMYEDTFLRILYAGLLIWDFKLQITNSKILKNSSVSIRKFKPIQPLIKKCCL